MAGDDPVLRGALRRAADYPDTGGVYEQVVRRRTRYRLRKRMSTATLAAILLVVMGAATWTLARSFGLGTSQPATQPPPTVPAHSLTPTSDPGPTTTPSTPSTSGPPSPTAEPACRQPSGARGDFNGDGEPEVARLHRCADGWFFELDQTYPTLRWELHECAEGCALLAAPDLDLDGTDELAVVTFNFSIQSVFVFEARNEMGPAAITVAAPGDPAGQFEPGKAADLGFGGDAFSTYNVRCEDRPEGRVLVATAAESLPHDSVDAVWHVHETVLRFASSPSGVGSFEVVSVNDFTLPTNGPEERPLFADHDHFCGAPTAP